MDLSYQSTAWLRWVQQLPDQARLKAAQSDLDGALVLLDEAERRSIREPLPDVRPIAAHRARVWLQQGRWRAAESWANEQGLSADDTPSYLREFEHLTLARVLIARFHNVRDAESMRTALHLLARLGMTHPTVALQPGTVQPSIDEFVSLCTPDG